MAAAFEGSVTQWIHQLQAGDRDAAQELWNRYFQRLVGLARCKLQGAQRRAADEEDVVLSAFESFFRGAEQGRFPRLQRRWARVLRFRFPPRRPSVRVLPRCLPSRGSRGSPRPRCLPG